MKTKQNELTFSSDYVNDIFEEITYLEILEN